ncbi:MAG: transglutaminase-like domain-containing protein [Micrococcales bacterium]|nr:transglutaminase-like domain-containing protein [Micrococcales bacterium]
MTAPTPRRALRASRTAVGQRRAVVDVVVLVALLALAAVPLLPVYGGSAAVPALAVGLVAGTALAVVGAWGRWAAWLVTVVAVLLVVILGTPLTGAPTLAGLLPTPGGAGQVLTASFTTWKDALTLDPPLGGTGDVLLAPFLLTFLGALVALTLALRTRRTVGALAGVVVLVVSGVAALLGTATQPVPPLVTGTVLVAVLLTWASLRAGSGVRRRPASAGALLGLVVVGALLLAPVTAGEPRFVLRDHVVPPFDPTAHPSPLAAFRSYVKADDEVLFTVKGLPEGARVRLAVMDRYDGMVWNVAGGRAAQGSGEFRRVGSAVATADEGVEAEVTFTIEGLSDMGSSKVWLPTVGSATSFDLDQSVARDLRYNDATGAAVLTSGVRPGLTYTERVVVANLDMRDSDIGTARSADVVLPDDTGVSGALSRQAASIAQDATTPVGQARALASWLSENGYFSHGLDGEHPSLPGHGAARMSRLLDAPPMVGDGEQYASALALMARSMNLRARVVIGFVPGAGDAETAAQAEAKVTDGVIEVRGKDVQAWVEIAFAGIGWVAFDATPPTSRQATEQEEEQQTHSQPQVLQPPVQPPVPQTEPDDDARPPQTDSPDAARQGSGWVRVLTRVGGGLGLLLLLASPVLAVLGAKYRRLQRRRRAADPVEAVTGGWAELVDAAVDLRWTPSPVDTRRESAAVIGAVAGGAGADDPALPVRLGDLAVRADRAAFAPSPPSPDQAEQYWSDVDETRQSLWHAVPWRTRMAGRVSLRSLRTRRPGDRRAAAPVGRRER